MNEQITALKDLISVIQDDQKNVRESLTSAFSTSSVLNERSENSPKFIKKIIPPKPVLQQDQSIKDQINGCQIS